MPKARIIAKYLDHETGIIMAVIFRFGMVYVIPYNLAMAN